MIWQESVLNIVCFFVPSTHRPWRHRLYCYPVICWLVAAMLQCRPVFHTVNPVCTHNLSLSPSFCHIRARPVRSCRCFISLALDIVVPWPWTLLYNLSLHRGSLGPVEHWVDVGGYVMALCVASTSSLHHVKKGYLYSAAMSLSPAFVQYSLLSYFTVWHFTLVLFNRLHVSVWQLV